MAPLSQWLETISRNKELHLSVSRLVFHSFFWPVASGWKHTVAELFVKVVIGGQWCNSLLSIAITVCLYLSRRWAQTAQRWWGHTGTMPWDTSGNTWPERKSFVQEVLQKREQRAALIHVMALTTVRESGGRRRRLLQDRSPHVIWTEREEHDVSLAYETLVLINTL